MNVLHILEESSLRYDESFIPLPKTSRLFQIPLRVWFWVFTALVVPYPEGIQVFCMISAFFQGPIRRIPWWMYKNQKTGEERNRLFHSCFLKQPLITEPLSLHILRFSRPFIYLFSEMTFSFHLQRLIKSLFSFGAFCLGFYALLHITRELGEYEIKTSSMGTGRLAFWCQLDPDSNTNSASCLLCVLRKITLSLWAKG